MNPLLKKILIKTKREIYSENLGNNSSLKKGKGYDFCELKEYEYGDDVKNIDWLISAKMQKPYIKQYHAQKELNIKIVSILTGSMHFGTKKFKQDILTQLACAIAFICTKQSDPFESFIANESLEICTKKSKKIFNVNFMAENLINYNCIGKSINYKKILNDLFKNISHKSIIFLIGDFFDTKDLDLKLLCQKHEIIALILRDKLEENPIELGNINFLDPSSLNSFSGIIDNNSKKNYINFVKENDSILYKHFQNCGIKFTKIYTHEDCIKKLIGILK